MIRLLGDAGRAAGLLAVGWRGPRALEALRARKLRRLVRHAYERVPYYRALMDGAGPLETLRTSGSSGRPFPVRLARGEQRARRLRSSSEVFDPTLRRQIVEDWSGEIISFYGAMEVGRIGAECRAHAGLHVDADALVVETPARLAELGRRLAAAIADTPVEVRAVDAIPHEGGKHRTFGSRIVAPDGAPRSPHG